MDPWILDARTSAAACCARAATSCAARRPRPWARRRRWRWASDARRLGPNDICNRKPGDFTIQHCGFHRDLQILSEQRLWICVDFTSLHMRSLLVPTMIKHVDVKETNMVIYHELHTIHCQECGCEEGKSPTVPTRNRDLTTKTSPPKLWFQSDESKGFFSHNWSSLNTASGWAI